MRATIKLPIIITLLILLAAAGGQAAASAGPAWTGPSFIPFFSPANASNSTTSIAPVILTSTVFRQNATEYFHPVLARWEHFSFYQNATSSEYSTTSTRQFVAQDRYYAGVEEHDDPDRMELNRFLEDDEPPNRPLL